MFPEIPGSPVAQDSNQVDVAYQRSFPSLVNDLIKNSVAPIEADNAIKNNSIRASFWFNPLSFFQNRFNRIAGTHYDDYQNYRTELQSRIDKQINLMVSDMWAGKVVNLQAYQDYYQKLSANE